MRLFSEMNEEELRREIGRLKKNGNGRREKVSSANRRSSVNGSIWPSPT